MVLKLRQNLTQNFVLDLSMNPSLSQHKFYLNFMTKFLTFKTFMLDLRQFNLRLKTFCESLPCINKYDINMFHGQGGSIALVSLFLSRAASEPENAPRFLVLEEWTWTRLIA